ncbi:MAG TPA: hypothetical protein VF384_08075 [Planctomycetota bacterium]
MRPIVCAFVLAVAACAGCVKKTESLSESGTMSGPQPIDAARAVELFRVAWGEKVLPAVPEKERESAAYMYSLMQKEPDKLVARPESCRACAAHVRELEALTKGNYGLYGTLDALDRDGDCWAVMYQGGMKREIEGYLTPDTGELLYVRRTPEG